MAVAGFVGVSVLWGVAFEIRAGVEVGWSVGRSRGGVEEGVAGWQATRVRMTPAQKHQPATRRAAFRVRETRMLPFYPNLAAQIVGQVTREETLKVFKNL